MTVLKGFWCQWGFDATCVMSCQLFNRQEMNKFCRNLQKGAMKRK